MRAKTDSWVHMQEVGLLAPRDSVHLMACVGEDSLQHGDCVSLQRAAVGIEEENTKEDLSY